MEEKNPEWVKLKPKEVEKLVIGLCQKGETPSSIGIILRDRHGIPKTKLLGKKITSILKENKVKYKTEEEVMKEKIEKVKSHIDRNKHDYTAKRSLTKKLWHIKRL